MDPARLEAARARILRLRSHFAALVQPPLDVVGCEDHRRLARQIADASVTLVRDPDRALPLSAAHGDRVAVVAPVPVDLTPAETSSYLRVGLAEALRSRGLAVDEFTAPLDPTPADVAALTSATSGYATTIVCTFDAVSFPGQAVLVSRLAVSSVAGATADGPGRRVVAVALRSPYDRLVVTRQDHCHLHLRHPAATDRGPRRCAGRPDSIRRTSARRGGG